jgi:xylulokinase
VLVYAVDVGTTNLKVVLYDERLTRRAIASAPARYEREADRVEFDPALLFRTVLDLIGRCAASVPDTGRHEAVIAITGQAESLVLVDRSGDTVRPGLSWLDSRATAEADELGETFGSDEAFAVTGQPYPSATWPAAKLRWLQRHEPDALDAAASVLMIKDDLIRRFAGRTAGEVTTRGFTYFWDVRKGSYWAEMLEHCGVSEDRLPEVVPAGTELGAVLPAVAAGLPPSRGYRVNVGALDHFCAMAGTSSYAPGLVSESAGTVLSVSQLTRHWIFDPRRKVSFHSGLRDGDTVLFNGVDGGGAALEWFRLQALAGMRYGELERHLQSRRFTEAPMFLPYLTGVNPPDFFPDAKGAFLDLDLGHDRIDMAFAVEEGVAHLLRRNIDYLSPDRAHEIVSTGGGAASAFWNQLKADVCRMDVVVPDEHEATCRGAAILALIEAGELAGLEDAAELQTPEKAVFRPADSARRDARYRRFEQYLDRLYAHR